MSEQDTRIECRICGERVHAVKMHLTEKHGAVTEQEYQAKFPGAPMLSKKAQDAIAQKAAQRKAATAAAPAMSTAMAGATLAVVGGTEGPVRKPFHELFGFDSKEPGAMSASGRPTPISVMNIVGPDRELIPDVDNNHVFDVENTKNICLALELDIPVYAWGHAGTSKTTTLLQVAARTGRPAIRVQHTINTEESHIVGQWIVKGGETVYQLGPLAQAMLNGWLYIADEYDFALPSVLSVYQPVLEPSGTLVIKDAPPEFRVIKKHPNFRIAATGNTNGIGDESGLYQGTNVQNAANYERFGVTLKFHYMRPEKEVQIIVNQCKPILQKDAEVLVDFANKIRMQYDAQQMTATISPRALIFAARLGLYRGSFSQGLQLAFINRLGKVDREAAEQVVQRLYGTK